MPTRKNTQRHFSAPTCVLLAVLVASCASPPAPPQVYSSSGVDSRTLIYPMIDLRADGALDIASCNQDQPIKDSSVMTSMLTKSNFAANFGLKADVSKDDLDKKNTERLKQIPSAGHHYVVLIYLEEFDFKNAFSTFAWKITSYVVRSDTGQIVWTQTYDDWKWLGVLDGPLQAAMGNVPLRPGAFMPKCSALDSLVARPFRSAPSLPAY